jgi:hypothetical protein
MAYAGEKAGVRLGETTKTRETWAILGGGLFSTVGSTGSGD